MVTIRWFWTLCERICKSLKTMTSSSSHQQSGGATMISRRTRAGRPRRCGMESVMLHKRFKIFWQVIFVKWAAHVGSVIPRNLFSWNVVFTWKRM